MKMSQKMIGAIDIGGTKIAAAMVSPSGELLAQAECLTEPAKGFANSLRRMQTMLAATAAKAGGELAGIGIGCTGRHDTPAGTLGGVGVILPGWDGVPLAGELSQVFGVSVVLENDADAAALGEAAWGAGREAKRFIYVTVSTGIGGGMVFDGRLYRGVDGAHPEIGHHVIDSSGPACFCGAHGCWESFASGPALARWWYQHYPDGVPPQGQLEAWQICALAEQGDLHALAAVEREGYYLGVGLGNLITLFAPDIIVLGGGVMQSRHLFWKRVQEVIAQNCGLVPYHKVRVLPAAFGTNAVLLGAARAWLLRYEENQ